MRHVHYTATIIWAEAVASQAHVCVRRHGRALPVLSLGVRRTVADTGSAIRWVFATALTAGRALRADKKRVRATVAATVFAAGRACATAMRGGVVPPARSTNAKTIARTMEFASSWVRRAVLPSVFVMPDGAERIAPRRVVQTIARRTECVTRAAVIASRDSRESIVRNHPNRPSGF